QFASAFQGRERQIREPRERLVLVPTMAMNVTIDPFAWPPLLCGRHAGGVPNHRRHTVGTYLSEHRPTILKQMPQAERSPTAHRRVGCPAVAHDAEAGTVERNQVGKITQS